LFLGKECKIKINNFFLVDKLEILLYTVCSTQMRVQWKIICNQKEVEEEENIAQISAILFCKI